MNMKLIVGLGNPGRKFKKTRHNVGFRVIDGFKRRNNFPKFKFSKKFQSLISEGYFNREKIVLIKPQTFMNDSGKAVKSLTKNYKLKIINLFVIHDDVDIPLGKIKISIGRGSAGHKGVQSIIDELNTKNFIRLRIGIKSTPNNKKKVKREFVLKKFTKKEEKVVRKITKETISAIEIALKDGLEKAMQIYNK